jgi:hypothetical protein
LMIFPGYLKICKWNCNPILDLLWERYSSVVCDARRRSAAEA